MVFSTTAIAAALLSSPLERPFVQGQNAFNPDMSVVFNFAARLADSSGASGRRAAMREIELGLAGDVDPYLRTEAYIAFAKPLDEDEGEVEVEEAFGAYTGLARGTEVRVGKLAGALGRVNRNHLDQLDFFEYPFVVTEVFGEEGLRAPGVSWAYLLPGDRFNELTVEALVPDDGPLFGGSDTGKPVILGHYRTFFDFSSDLSAQVGLSYATGPMEGGRSNVYGADFVAKFQPGGTGRNLVLESEAYWYESGAPGSTLRHGHFASVAYELADRLWLGARYDKVQLADGSDALRAYTGGVTLKLTEFQLVRLEYQHQDWRNAGSRNQLVLQVQWAIGPHRAHKY